MSATMQAMRKLAPGPGAQLCEVPVPIPGPREVLVQVRATSICGTDYHIYTWDPWSQGRVKPPLTVGHEFAGEVVVVGADVTAVRGGDWVSAETHEVCGVCPRCRQGEGHLCEDTRILGVDVDGCFAQYIAIPEANCWVNDHDLPWTIQSIQEPLGNAMHAAMAGDLVGCSVAVIGCGPIGVMSVPIARHAGAEIVIAVDVKPYRLDLAARLGADVVVNAQVEDPVAVIRRETRGHGADVILEMSGNAGAIRQALQAARKGARFTLLGLPATALELDLSRDVIMRGITLQGITGRRLWQTWYQVRSLLRSGLADRLQPLITHQLPLAQLDQGMALIESGRCGKVVLLPEVH